MIRRSEASQACFVREFKETAAPLPNITRRPQIDRLACYVLSRMLFARYALGAASSNSGLALSLNFSKLLTNSPANSLALAS